MYALDSRDTILTPEDLTKCSTTFHPMTMRMKPSEVCVSDIEGNNLLYNLTRFHCGVTLNPFTLEERTYGPKEAKGYLDRLDTHQVVVGHNFRGFDLLALSKLFGYQYHGFCFDTLVLSRLLNPEKKLHSLESYGYKFKFLKGDYAKSFKAAQGQNYVEGMEWWEFSEEMLEYCVQDVRLNAYLFLWMIVKLGWFDWFGATKEDCLSGMEAIKLGKTKRV